MQPQYMAMLARDRVIIGWRIVLLWEGSRFCRTRYEIVLFFESGKSECSGEGCRRGSRRHDPRPNLAVTKQGGCNHEMIGSENRSGRPPQSTLHLPMNRVNFR
jgi:hypothetical protein